MSKTPRIHSAVESAQIEPKIEHPTADKTGVNTQNKTQTEPEAVSSVSGSEEVSSKQNQQSIWTSLNNAVTWFKRTFHGHEHTIIFGVLGFVAAIIYLFFDFFQSLVVVIFVLVGVALGQKVDGDPKIINFVKRLFRHF